jgi:hypothetical protein
MRDWIIDNWFILLGFISMVGIWAFLLFGIINIEILNHL